MTYNFQKVCAKVLKDLKIGDLISTADLHQRIVNYTGFSKPITRANLLRNMESTGYIKLKGLGMFEVLSIPEINPYELD